MIVIQRLFPGADFFLWIIHAGVGFCVFFLFEKADKTFI